MPEGYRLYIIRHAIAEERGDAYPDDARRPLTAKGRAKFRKAARGLAALGVSIDHVLSSPLVRARQTADILREEIGGHPDIVEVDALAPEATYDAVRSVLGDCGAFPSIALVGHEPSIGQLAARLAGLRAPLEMKKGAVLRVDFEALPPSGPGMLRWFATPRILGKLG